MTEPLTPTELALQKRWLDETVEPHLDAGGQATTGNAAALLSALRQAHATIDHLKRVAGELLAVLEMDGPMTADDPDEDCVGWQGTSEQAPMAMTFGHIRRLRAAVGDPS